MKCGTASKEISNPSTRRSMCKFVRNLYEMASNTENSLAVGFSPDGVILEFRDVTLLTHQVLPKYFKHGNLSSLVRQLNNYDFRTIPPRLDGNVTHAYFNKFFSLHHHLTDNDDDNDNALTKIQPRRTSTAAARMMTATTTMPPVKKLALSVEPTNSCAAVVETPPLHHPHHQQALEFNALLKNQNSELQRRICELEQRVRLVMASNSNVGNNRLSSLSTIPPPPPPLSLFPFGFNSKIIFPLTTSSPSFNHFELFSKMVQMQQQQQQQQ